MRSFTLFLFFFLTLVNSSPGQESLPRVLIIGDRVYQQHAPQIKRELKEHVQVIFGRLESHAPINSQTVLAELDAILGDDQWDVIHFNVGLGDLVYRAPGMQSFRSLPAKAGGVRTTSPDRYEQNLNRLVGRLQATGAKLIWATTTPIRSSTTGVFQMGTEKTYNAIAGRVMKKHGIAINDMYTSVLSIIDMSRPAGHGADPFNFDKKPIHSPIVEAILAQIPQEVGSDPSNQ